MASSFCSTCEIDTETIIDHRAGYNLCSRCGSVLEISPFDEIPDLPIFSDSDENYDEFEYPLFEIDMSTWGPSLNSKDQKNVKTPLKKSLKLLAVMGDRLRLTKELKERAAEIYNMVDYYRACRGRSLNSIVAACFFIACKESGSSRTLSEIAKAADGVSRKSINRTAESIKKQLEVETWKVQPGDLIERLCSNLGLGNQAIKAVKEAVERTEYLDIRRSPKTVLAAIIYMVIQLSHDKEPAPVKDIAKVMEVTEITIRKSFKDISIFGSKLIPDWYAKEEDIKKIPVP
ncbi:hypothetical protein Gohar_020154 [Gossypium harknessii]|uniref:TFIIB-type domain-containing protein n=1 Tax=Gossypium harknessii TaxID=34285 RepID=A0A7J9HZI3_9ROSI|nr:hypothetical protein [Gossypium harknessii]